MNTILLLYNRRDIRGTNAQRVARAQIVAAGLAVIAFIVFAVLMPIRESVMIQVDLPERTAELIQAQAIPEPPAPAARQQVSVERVEDVLPENPPDHLSLPAPKTHRDDAPVDPDAGKIGRERARQATAQLASASDPLDKSLDNLARALAARVDGTPVAGGRRRDRVGSGRAADAIGAIDAGLAGSGSADLRSSVEGTQVAIGSLAPSRATASEASEGADSRGSAPGVYRSNASLLAVIQRYSAGIQYCYGNELKRDPRLSGKLVVALTVAASGEVSEVTVVQNTIGSQRLSSCALAQIREWKFPPIASGLTTFQVPFVFTPPN